MATPEARTGFAERCAEVCAGFRAVAAVRRARKSELLAGEVDGAPVIAKRMLKPNAVWDWYFAREVAIYRAFAAQPPPFRVPRVYAATDDVLVIERFPSAVSRLRRPYAELPASTIEALLAYRAAIVAWTGRFPDDAPPPQVRSQLRQRLLEDPNDPTWIRDGLERCCQRDLIHEGTRDAAIETLVDARIAPAHGDLLLRNAMTFGHDADPRTGNAHGGDPRTGNPHDPRTDAHPRTGDPCAPRWDGRAGEVVLVDWECAGRYLADWDLALLWTQLGEAGRRIVEPHAGPAFFALVLFALCRELVFLQAFRVPEDHDGVRRVRDELAEVARRLV